MMSQFNFQIFKKASIQRDTRWVLVEMNGECTYMNVGVKPCVIKHLE